MTFNVLTVGDGDLSFSLALKRAYPQINVTASTLVESPSELHQTYANAIETCKEFQETWNEPIVYGTDATKLEKKIIKEVDRGVEEEEESELFDIVLFNHPHLGDGALLLESSEARHAERHFVLLSHYFHSAKKIIKKDGSGRVHVCLCGNQPNSWNIMMAAHNNGLHCVKEESTAVPIDLWLFEQKGGDETTTTATTYELAKVQPHYPTKRKFRNGSLGSKHYLARFGYRHQRTEGDLHNGSVKQINVEQSVNFVFACNNTDTTSDEQQKSESVVRDGSSGEEKFECHVCKLKFDTREELTAHWKEPSLPDVVTGAYGYGNKRSSNVGVGKKNESTTPQNQTNNVKKHHQQQQQQPTAATVTQSSLFKSIKFEDATILIEATIANSALFDSKRLKWLCRQDEFPLSKFIKSKRECMNAIRKGRVFVNRQVALDSSRIVREGDVVSLVEEYEPAATSDDNYDERIANNAVEDLGVRIVKELPLQRSKDITVVVAYKPVGIRCIGSFTPNTLEMITKRCVERNRGTKNIHSHSVSKLDTGVAGLSVLLLSSSSKINDEDLHSVKVSYTFSALVHGSPPEEWKDGVYVPVPTAGLRQWKRQKTNHQNEKKSSSGDVAVDVDATMEHKSSSTITSPSNTVLDLDSALFIQCHDSLQIEGDEQRISTITVQSRFDNGRLANVISFVLRKLGYPVVNDRFGKREFSALPRRIKNIVKQKVCIGCYCADVECEGVVTMVNVERHKRTQCSFWREALS